VVNRYQIHLGEEEMLDINFKKGQRIIDSLSTTLPAGLRELLIDVETADLPLEATYLEWQENSIVTNRITLQPTPDY